MKRGKDMDIQMNPIAANANNSGQQIKKEIAALKKAKDETKEQKVEDKNEVKKREAPKPVLKVMSRKDLQKLLLMLSTGNISENLFIDMADDSKLQRIGELLQIGS